MLFLLFFWIKILDDYGIRFFGIKISLKEFNAYKKRFYNFSGPLFIYSLVALVCDVGDRWILQVYGGSIEQGYFGFALRIASICFIFTSAMTPLILREFSVEFKNKNLINIANLFKKNIPLLYFVGAYFCLFFSFNYIYIIELIGGDDFMLGKTAFVLMTFYPIQQTYGQLSNSLFYATNQTKLYRNIAVFTSLIGLLTTFILIGPKYLGGLNLGSTGLAIKKLLIQFIGVSLALYFNLKYLKLSLIKFFGHKILVVVLLSLFSFISSQSMSLIFENKTLVFIFSGVTYTFFVLCLIYFYPRIIVRSKKELKLFLNSLIK